ncbi:MAG: hypothetical protein U9R32_08195, partial [Bacteroidota bacterium]|nr:hypothetical protein [Bacteroidota bacterium]
MDIWILLFSLIPAVIIAATFYFLLKKFVEEKSREKLIDLKAQNNKTIVPIRLQAYERMILLLERISPSSMIFRVITPTMSATDLHSALLVDIRNEFEHNLSQQLYISKQAWINIKNAREELVRIINTAATQLQQEASAQELSTEIFALYVNEDSSLQTAINTL